MNEVDVLKTISENLTNRKNSTALSNYLVLCNNIGFLHAIFDSSLHHIKDIKNDIENELNNDGALLDSFKDKLNPHFYFRAIIPQILFSDINVMNKLLEQTRSDERAGITIENVSKLSKRFIDYNNLVTATRQFIDSLVADAYQLLLLEAKEMNYQILNSLSSFKKFATKSIIYSLYNEEIINSLVEFEKLNYNQQKSSSITECKNDTFSKKINFICSKIGMSEAKISDEFKNIFKFSSEFTHIGYTSTFFTSAIGSEVVFTDEISPYLPSTENFSELKYKIIESCLIFLSKIYLPSINLFLNRTFTADISNNISIKINNTIDSIIDSIKTRNNTYYCFIKEGLIESENKIRFNCMCGNIVEWETPHVENEPYCKSCGSRFKFLVISGNAKYIITSAGPAQIIGT